MRELIEKWAAAGDPNALIKLAHKGFPVGKNDYKIRSVGST